MRIQKYFLIFSLLLPSAATQLARASEISLEPLPCPKELVGKWVGQLTRDEIELIFDEDGIIHVRNTTTNGKQTMWYGEYKNHQLLLERLSPINGFIIRIKSPKVIFMEYENGSIGGAFMKVTE